MAKARANTRQTKAVETAVTAVAGITKKGALDKLQEAKLALDDHYAKLDATLMGSLEIKENLDLANEKARQDLKELHDIEATAETLQSLKDELDCFTSNMDKERERIENDHNELVASQQKTWAQEEAEHKYQIDQRNKKAELELKALSEERQRQEKFRMEDFNKMMEVRLTALTDRETKMTDLEAAVAGIQAKVDSAVSTAVATATSSMKRDYDYQTALAKKDTEVQIGLLSGQLKALQAALAVSESRNADLAAAAKAAQEQVQAIASKAVDASSGKAALAAVQQTIENQPATTSRGR